MALMTRTRAGRSGQGQRILDRLARARPPWLTRVHGRSMEPTLHDGQLVVTQRLLRTDDVRRGDLVLAESPDVGRRIVKRVIGMPNERIVIIDGLVVVDGHPLNEPYARSSTFNGQFRVPENAYLLLGDNRDASNDSRVWTEPYISRHQLSGRLHPLTAPGPWPCKLLLTDGWATVG